MAARLAGGSLASLPCSNLVPLSAAGVIRKSLARA